jgi:hypothetical protein
MQLRSVWRLVLAALSLLACGVAVSAADPPAQGGKDILDEARRRDQVAEQKAESDFRAALLEMSKLENANPGRAAQRLRKMLSVLEEDTALSATKRDAWKRVVKDRIRVCEAECDRAEKGEVENGVREAKKDDRRAAQEQKAREEEKIAQELKAIKDMKDRDEAARRAADLARRHPDNPSAIAARTITGTNDRLRQMRMIKAEKENGWTLAMMDVERSAVLPKDPDINFPSPAKWKEITKARSKSVATEKEKAILKALETPVSVSFEGSTLENVIDYLQTLSGVPILLDKDTLDRAGLNYDTPVTVRKMRVSLRTTLRKILGDVGLTYIVEKETIHILTPEQAKKKMTVRTYYIGDLAGIYDGFNYNAFTQQAMANTVTMLIQNIVGMVEPDSWKINNPDADGTIAFDPVHMTLIVKQSAEIHYMLGGFGR